MLEKYISDYQSKTQRGVQSLGIQIKQIGTSKELDEEYLGGVKVCGWPPSDEYMESAQKLRKSDPVWPFEESRNRIVAARWKRLEEQKQRDQFIANVLT